MATVKDIINLSLRYMGVSTKFKTPSASDYELMLVELNSMLDMWYKLGLRARYNNNELKLQNVFPYPNDTHTGIAYNLAVDGYPLFDSAGMPSPKVEMLAAEKKNEIWTEYAADPSTVFPGTLPIGTGNTDHTYDNWTAFYPDCDENLYSDCTSNQLESESGVILTGVDNDVGS